MNDPIGKAVSNWAGDPPIDFGHVTTSSADQHTAFNAVVSAIAEAIRQAGSIEKLCDHDGPAKFVKEFARTKTPTVAALGNLKKVLAGSIEVEGWSRFLDRVQRITDGDERESAALLTEVCWEALHRRPDF